MPDPTPIPDQTADPQAPPATADAAFIARTSQQSDAQVAAQYLAAHPEEAKNYGVNLPGQQAAPAPAPTAGPPQAAPAQAPSQPADPSADAVNTAKTTYPRIANIPMKLTTGTGPGMSETYEPGETGEGGNPSPGNWTVQLRHPSVVQDKSKWPDYVALESLHPLFANDPGYRALTHQFVQSMTPEQTADAQQAYARDKKTFGITEPFSSWLPRVQAQEYIRGMVFSKTIPNWVGPGGAGKYTPEQLKLGQQIDQYLRTPQTPGDINQQIQQRAQDAGAQPGVPTAGQEALQAPAVDPVFALAGGLQAGAAGGVMAGVKSAAESGVAMEVQDAASRLTGLATDNPYLKGIVGIVAPIALSILAKRGISAAGGGAEPSAAPATAAAPETYPQGTVLDAQGQPVTSAPAEPAPVAETPQVPDPAADRAKWIADGNRGIAPIGYASGVKSATSQGVAPEAPGATAPEPSTPSYDTPQGAAQTLAEKQLAALKTARVGKRVATEFGKPEIATVVPERQTFAESQALRQNVEMPTEPGVEQPQMAAHTAAVAGVYQDEAAGIRADATRIQAAQDAGQDMAADKAALANRFSAYAINYANLAGMRSEMGRGLQILDPLKPGNVMAGATAKLAQELNPDDVDTLVDRLSKLGPEQQAAMARQVGEAAQQGRSVSGKISEYFYNALLSRPTTLVKKMIGDVSSWALNSPTRALAARIPIWGSAPKVALGEGAEFAYGSIAAHEDALRVAGNTWSLGGSAIDALGGGKGGEFEPIPSTQARGAPKGGIMDTGADLLGDVAQMPGHERGMLGDTVSPPPPQIPGKLGTVVRLPTQTMGTAHEYSRFANFRGELRALALRQATHEAGLQGMTGEEAGNVIKKRTEALANNPTPELFDAAHSAANYNVFSQPLGPTGQAFNDWLDKLPAGLGRIAFPFRRVPINLAKWALNYTPIPAIVGAPGAAVYGAGRAMGANGEALGGMLNSFYTDMAAGGAPAQLALAKLSMGSAAMMGVHQAVMDGYITGGGPNDPRLYRDLVATGWQPYSFHIGDHYYGFQNFEPLAMHLGLAADYSTIMSHMPQYDVEHAAVAGAMAIGKNLSRQSYVTMLVNLNKAMDDMKSGRDSGEIVEKFLGNEAAGIIPAALRAEARREDPVMRDTRGMYDTFLSQIPGYSKTMPPLTDALNRPILTPPGFLANEMQPFKVGADKHDPIANETARLGANPERAPTLLPGSGAKAPSLMTSPTDPNVGIPLNGWDQNEWKQLRATLKDDDGPGGQTLVQTLNALLKDPDYQTAPQEAQRKQWEQTWTNYGHMATNQMNERPDLKQKLELRQQYKDLAELAPGETPGSVLQSHGTTPLSQGGSL